jgi:uncharacterized membrane protein
MLLFPHVYSEEDYDPSELSVYLYVDGATDIEYRVDVDPTLARVNITLFGESYEDFIVRDPEDALLDYKIYQGYSSIDVLGSISVEIDYTTYDLTNKTRSLWTLSLLAPVNANIQLPEGASIMGLDPTPLSINIVENKATLTMPSGEIAVSYLLGTVGTRENALMLIKEAEAAIEEAIIENIRVEEAETLLQQAREAYDEAQYSKAEQIAVQAKDSAVETVSLAQEAKIAMNMAESSITSAQKAGRTSLIDQATRELQQAQEHYDAGEYEEAKTLAEQASTTAQQSKSTKAPLTPQILILLGAVLIAALVVFFKLFWKRPKPEARRVEGERFEIDVDSIFREKTGLRMDEKEVIRFIAAAGGEVFVAEIRDRFDIPRTSLWRMTRRLEEEEIVETRKVGRETYVKISPKYALKRAEEG